MPLVADNENGDEVKYESFNSTLISTSISSGVETESATVFISGSISPASMFWSAAM